MPAIVNYFEIGGPDADGAREFYGGLFDWTFGDPSPLDYRSIDGAQGGLWGGVPEGDPSWAIFYVMVDDVRATITAAEARGAAVVVPYTDNGAIEFAHLRDPQGNRFGVWKPHPRG